jgi:hypothetical protein
VLRRGAREGACNGAVLQERVPFTLNGLWTFESGFSRVRGHPEGP